MNVGDEGVKCAKIFESNPKILSVSTLAEVLFDFSSMRMYTTSKINLGENSSTSATDRNTLILEAISSWVFAKASCKGPF